MYLEYTHEEKSVGTRHLLIVILFLNRVVENVYKNKLTI